MQVDRQIGRGGLDHCLASERQLIIESRTRRILLRSGSDDHGRAGLFNPLGKETQAARAERC